MNLAIMSLDFKRLDVTVNRSNIISLRMNIFAVFDIANINMCMQHEDSVCAPLELCV